MEPRALGGPAFFSNRLADALKFARHLLISGGNVIECIRDLSRKARPVTREAHGEVAVPHCLQAGQDHVEIRGHGPAVAGPLSFHFQDFAGAGSPGHVRSPIHTFNSLHNCLPGKAANGSIAKEIRNLHLIERHTSEINTPSRNKTFIGTGLNAFAFN